MGGWAYFDYELKAALKDGAFTLRTGLAVAALETGLKPCCGIPPCGRRGGRLHPLKS